MRILVTGATGFIGTNLIPLLLKQGHSVRVLVRNKKIAEEKFGSTCEIFVGDITDKESLQGCCEGIETVYHLAALMGHDSPGEEAFERFRRVNVIGVHNLVQECKRCDIRRFIHVSSTAAMGLLKEPIVDESTECRPYTPYQVTKYEGEQAVLQEFFKNGFPAIVVRPSMIYGPGFKGDFLTIAKLCKTGFFPKFGKGKNLSPALYITDLVQGLALLCDKGTLGEIYLISSDGSYSLNETSDVIGKALHKKIHYFYCPVWMALAGAVILEKGCAMLHRKPPVTKRNIQSIVTDRVFDITKMKKEMQFQPQVSLNKGLTRTIQYYLKQSYL